MGEIHAHPLSCELSAFSVLIPGRARRLRERREQYVAHVAEPLILLFDRAYARRPMG
jgi:hypothetical protein